MDVNALEGGCRVNSVALCLKHVARTPRAPLSPSVPPLFTTACAALSQACARAGVSKAHPRVRELMACCRRRGSSRSAAGSTLGPWPGLSGPRFGLPSGPEEQRGTQAGRERQEGRPPERGAWQTALGLRGWAGADVGRRLWLRERGA